MKISAGTIGTHVAIFVWSIFMGITFVSIGLGAIYPPLNLVAKPFVCPNGQMTFNESTSNPLPGTTYTQIGWYCVDSRNETATELDIFQIAAAAGPIYGLVIEVLALIVVLKIQRTNQSSAGSPGGAPARRATNAFSQNAPRSHPSPLPADTRNPASPDALARMKELKRLRAEQMITEAEYQQKRDEILKDL